MPRTNETDLLCSECWDRALYAYGTAELFLRRSRLYTKWLKALSFAGILIPLLIGAIVMAFKLDPSVLSTLVAVAAIAAIVQLVLSTFSIVYNWPESLQYSLESAAENFDISTKFSDLGRTCTEPPVDLAHQVALLKARDDARRSSDAKQNVTQKELRYAHRAGLRQFGRPCEGCRNVPTTMESSNCGVCGRF